MNKRNKNMGLKRTLAGTCLTASILWSLNVVPSFAVSTNPSLQREYEAYRIDGNGLKITHNDSRHGGYKIDLKGRFGSPRTAIKGRDGKVRIGHEPLPKIEHDDDNGSAP